MSASLVGSEMCIRDRDLEVLLKPARMPQRFRLVSPAMMPGSFWNAEGYGKQNHTEALTHTLRVDHFKDTNRYCRFHPFCERERRVQILYVAVGVSKVL
eukprot:12590005-Alexandrium_andersonii.AAC.1